jgi:cell division protein ZipA
LPRRFFTDPDPLPIPQQKELQCPTVTLLRIGILIAGLILIGAIVFLRPPAQAGAGQARRASAGAAPTAQARAEPTPGRAMQSELGRRRVGGEAPRRRLELFDQTLEGTAPNSELGRAPAEEFDKIVTLYLAARAGQKLHGPDIVVAARKGRLVYGHMGVFHRLVENHPERGPVFSVANIMKPGSFDMAAIQALETPAIAFFLTLPAPVDRAGCLGNHAADRAAHGRSARRRGAG